MTMHTDTARLTIRKAADANGWVRHDQSGTWDYDVYVRGTVKINARFGVRGAMTHAVRELPDFAEETGSRGKRDTVLQWLRRPADVDAPLDLVQRVLDGPVAELPPMGQVDRPADWTDPMDAHGAGEPVAIGTGLHRHLEATATQAAREAVNLLGIWATGSAAGDPATRAAQDEIINRLGSLEANLAAADQRAAELERKLETTMDTGKRETVLAWLREDVAPAAEIPTVEAVDAAQVAVAVAQVAVCMDQAVEDGAIVEGLVRVIGQLEARAAQVTSAARDLVQYISQEGRSTARTMRAAQRVGQLTGDPSFVSLAERRRADLSVVADPAPPTDADDMLRRLGVQVPTHLAEDVASAREYALSGGAPLVRTFGIIDHGQLLTSASHEAPAVALALIPAYVDAVRAAGFPAPARRAELLAELETRLSAG